MFSICFAILSPNPPTNPPRPFPRLVNNVAIPAPASSPPSLLIATSAKSNPPKNPARPAPRAVIPTATINGPAPGRAIPIAAPATSRSPTALRAVSLAPSNAEKKFFIMVLNPAPGIEVPRVSANLSANIKPPKNPAKPAPTAVIPKAAERATAGLATPNPAPTTNRAPSAINPASEAPSKALMKFFIMILNFAPGISVPRVAANLSANIKPPKKPANPAPTPVIPNATPTAPLAPRVAPIVAPTASNAPTAIRPAVEVS